MSESDAKAAETAEKKTVTTDTREIEKTVSAVEMEKRRVKSIENLCRMNKLDEKYERMFVGQGLSIDDVGDEILKIIEERGKHNPQSVAKLGLGNRETEQFSLIRAIQACAAQNWHNAPFELECSQAVAKRMNRVADPQRFYVPFEVLHRPLSEEGRQEVAARMSRKGQRDLTVLSSGGGGYLVGTDNVGFIDLLRNRSVAFRMGARRLSGLTNNITIPGMSVAGTPYWLASESTAATESQQTFTQLPLSPKTCAAYTEISRQLLLQSTPGAEGIVTDDLAQVVATAADLAVLDGAGSGGEPQGLIGAGIGSVSAGSLSYDSILDFQVDLATANVMPSAGGYVTTPSVAKLAMSRARFSNTDTPLWTGNIWDGMVSGFPAMSSNQMPSAKMLFGDWQEVVVAEWGVLEVEVNPYADFKAGIVGVRCMYSLDVGVRRLYAFSVMDTIT